ncbi:WD40 repeat protein [Geodermatophilus bullaregiensis]|uniref:AAA family ATPase n=1 Tax=Geodermatophilus bullaregiensis TaxID=1564160 RepID=UPI00195DF558|nr:AAA family ATPase [Geodermatophilus bullaregiensis]MBM7806190.1 WD40 repeat protein [Geodermatophilus bullaregiensis]
MTSTDTPQRVSNPYVGPTSFRLGDALYGRDREREDLVDLLVAERIVLLYSPSGAGKTSLIQAALVPALRDDGFEVLPVIRVTHTLEPRPGLPAPRNRYVMSVLLSLEEGLPPETQRPVAELATLTLRQYLEAYADRDGLPDNEVLLFDQFEEVLTADPTDEAAKHEFFRQLGEALRDRGYWALFSMREDFLAALDPYLHHVPTRLRTTFRLDLLSVDEALEAMRRPAQDTGVNFTEEAARQLVDDLRTVRVQRPGGVTEALGSYVEPVQLQVACHLLWSMLPHDASEITRGDVEALGRVDQALGDYYAERVLAAAEQTGVPERVIRDWFEERLITPQGLRSQVLQGPEPSTEAGHRLLGELLDAHLVRAESRRQATWYELAHDRLIEPVRRDNAAWRAQHLSSLERATVLWDQEGRPDRLLLLGTDLALAEQDEVVRTGALTRRQQEFIQASRRADEQVRLERRTAAALHRSARRLKIVVAVTTLLAVAAGYFLVQSRQAESRVQAQETIYQLLSGVHRDLARNQQRAVPLAAVAADTAAFAADESRSDGLDEPIRDLLYETASASPVSMALRGQGPALSASLSRDGTTVVTAGVEALQIWDRTTGEAEERLPLSDASDVFAVDISSDGLTVVAGFVGGSILVWDVASGGIERWDESTGLLWNVLVSPDGTKVVTIGYDEQVQVWDRAGTPLFAVADKGSTSANDAAFSPDGRTLATVSDAPSAVLWDAATGDEIGRVPLPSGASEVTVGPYGQTLGTITSDQTVTVWDVASRRPLHEPFPEAPDPAAANALYRTLDADLSRTLTFQADGQLTVHDAATGRLVAQATVPGAALTQASFDVTDPSAVLVLSQDSDPAFWQLRPTGVNDAGAQAAFTLVVTSEQTFTIAADGTLSAWDARGGHHVISGAEGHLVSALAADPDGRQVAGITEDGRVHVWDVETGREVVVLGPDDFSMSDLAFTPDGAAIITGGWDGRLVRWDAGTGAELDVVMDDPNRSIAQVRVAPNGSRVLATLDPVSQDPSSPGNAQPVAVVLPLPGPGEPVELRLETAAEHEISDATWEYVNDAMFTHDGQDVALGTSSGRVASFDAGSGDLTWLEPVHSGAVRYVVIGPAGEVLTAGLDQQAVLSHPDTGERTRAVPTDSAPVAATFTPGGRHVALFHTNGHRSIMPLDNDDLLDLVRSKIVYDLSDADCRSYGLAKDC